MAKTDGKSFFMNLYEHTAFPNLPSSLAKSPQMTECLMRYPKNAFNYRTMKKNLYNYALLSKKSKDPQLNQTFDTSNTKKCKSQRD